MDDVLGQHTDKHGEGDQVDLDQLLGHLNDIIGCSETLDSWFLLLLAIARLPNSEEDERIVSSSLNLQIIGLSCYSLSVAKTLTMTMGDRGLRLDCFTDLELVGCL